MSEIPPRRDVTLLLRAWGAGDRKALDRLTPLVYKELHRMAHRFMSREKSGHSLQSTVLVNEVYLRLVDVKNVEWQDRAHFFALCARLMRHILTDFARSRQNRKHGGSGVRISLDESAVIQKGTEASLVALDDALKGLAEIDPRKSQVVEMRFFGGLTVEETAEALKISVETVMRDWKMAKAWLGRELTRVEAG
jgi:RNA polymerase sigma factor (TIGR02999 family)